MVNKPRNSPPGRGGEPKDSFESRVSRFELKPDTICVSVVNTLLINLHCGCLTAELENTFDSWRNLTTRFTGPAQRHWTKDEQLVCAGSGATVSRPRRTRGPTTY